MPQVQMFRPSRRESDIDYWRLLTQDLPNTLKRKSDERIKHDEDVNKIRLAMERSPLVPEGTEANVGPRGLLEGPKNEDYWRTLQPSRDDWSQKGSVASETNIIDDPNQDALLAKLDETQSYNREMLAPFVAEAQSLIGQSSTPTGSNTQDQPQTQPQGADYPLQAQAQAEPEPKGLLGQNGLFDKQEPGLFEGYKPSESNTLDLPLIAKEDPSAKVLIPNKPDIPIKDIVGDTSENKSPSASGSYDVKVKGEGLSVDYKPTTETKTRKVPNINDPFAHESVQDMQHQRSMENYLGITPTNIPLQTKVDTIKEDRLGKLDTQVQQGKLGVSSFPGQVDLKKTADSTRDGGGGGGGRSGGGGNKPKNPQMSITDQSGGYTVTNNFDIDGELVAKVGNGAVFTENADTEAFGSGEAAYNWAGYKDSKGHVTSQYFNSRGNNAVKETDIRGHLIKATKMYFIANSDIVRQKTALMEAKCLTVKQIDTIRLEWDNKTQSGETVVYHGPNGRERSVIATFGKRQNGFALRPININHKDNNILRWNTTNMPQFFKVAFSKMGTSAMGPS